MAELVVLCDGDIPNWHERLRGVREPLKDGVRIIVIGLP
jgi:hypothetical protein